MKQTRKHVQTHEREQIRKRRLGVSAKFVLVALVLVATLPAAFGRPTSVYAFFRVVNATTGVDSGDCVSSKCRTIGYALLMSLSEDTISIESGTYAEFPVINNDIHLVGAGPTLTFLTPNTGSPLYGSTPVLTVVSGFSATVSSLTIQNGNNANGAGIRNSGTLSLSGVSVLNNTATQGGGIENEPDGILTLNSVTIDGNTVTESGGGIYNYGVLASLGSTISNNSAGKDGGAIYNGGISTSSTFTNTTLSSNRATYQGGAIKNAGSGSQIRLNNVTIHNNSAGTGSLYASDGTIQIGNSIVANTLSGGTCSSQGGSGTFTSNGYNLDTANTCNFAQTGDKVNSNPWLGALMNLGGLTKTHGLVGGSGALNAGNPAAPGSGGNACASTDQRGVARPASTQCDMGAFEGQVPSAYLPVILKNY